MLGVVDNFLVKISNFTQMEKKKNLKFNSI